MRRYDLQKHEEECTGPEVKDEQPNNAAADDDQLQVNNNAEEEEKEVVLQSSSVEVYTGDPTLKELTVTK